MMLCVHMLPRKVEMSKLGLKSSANVWERGTLNWPGSGFVKSVSRFG